MKLNTRAGTGILVVAITITAGLVYSASAGMDMAGRASLAAGEATLHTYRTAQKLKSLVHAYELTINEYYSTVLEFPEYQKKATAIKAAIDVELAKLEKKNTQPETEVDKLNVAYGEIETLRLEIERALSGPDKDWDLAREVLYKLNLVSLQAVQSPEIIAQVAEDRAGEMEAAWKQHHAQALWKMQIAMALALGVAALAGAGAFRPAQVAPQHT